jgi:hypothetical protein
LYRLKVFRIHRITLIERSMDRFECTVSVEVELALTTVTDYMGITLRTAHRLL